MSGEMSFIDVQLAAQALQVLNELIEAIRRCRQRRTPVSPQVVADTAEIVLEVRNEAIPAVARCADPVNQNEGRSLSIARVSRLDWGVHFNPDTCRHQCPGGTFARGWGSVYAARPW